MCLVVVSKLLMRFDSCIYHPRKFLHDSFQPIPTCHPRRQLISDFCHHKLFLSVLLIQVSRIIPYRFLYLLFVSFNMQIFEIHSFTHAIVSAIYSFLLLSSIPLHESSNSFIHSPPFFFIWSWVYISVKHVDISIQSLGQIHLLFSPWSLRYLSRGPDTNLNYWTYTFASCSHHLFLYRFQ